MATPHARAAEAGAKTTMSPSPMFFTSVPPASAMRRDVFRLVESASRQEGPRWWNRQPRGMIVIAKVERREV
jgi:hypothetical protein